MYRTPLQSLFEHCYYQISDILWLSLGVLAALTIARTRWKYHLDWLIPTILSSGLTLVYRILISLHYFLHIQWTPTQASFFDAGECAADALGLYGMFILLRTLRNLVRGSAEPAIAAAEAEIGVWPPPPTVLK